MKVKTNLTNALEVADIKAQYDAQVKQILSNKVILAWILRETVNEMKPLSIDAIIQCIEGEPLVAEVPVFPGKETINGMSTESKIPNEGEITYDIRFIVITPGKQRIKLIINVEAQRESFRCYDLVKRAVFYCARMLSAQLDTEFKIPYYDDVKKVYSIWICMHPSKKTQNTITEYHMQADDRYGKYSGKAGYDLLSVIMIRIGLETQQEQQKLLKLLRTLLSDKMTINSKLDILESEYKIPRNRKIAEEAGNLCNLSELIEEKGIEKGIVKGKAEGKAEGKEEGRAEEENNFAALSRKLLEENRKDDLLRATYDTEYKRELYKFYGIG